MQWILVVYAYSCISSGGIDPGIIPGNCVMRGRTEITMPSQEVCVQIRDANKFANAECWAKVDMKPDTSGITLQNGPDAGTASNIAPHNFTLSPNVALPH